MSRQLDKHKNKENVEVVQSTKKNRTHGGGVFLYALFLGYFFVAAGPSSTSFSFREVCLNIEQCFFLLEQEGEEQNRTTPCMRCRRENPLHNELGYILDHLPPSLNRLFIAQGVPC